MLDERTVFGHNHYVRIPCDGLIVRFHAVKGDVHQSDIHIVVGQGLFQVRRAALRNQNIDIRIEFFIFGQEHGKYIGAQMDGGTYLYFALMKAVDIAKLYLKIIAQLQDFFSRADIALSGISGL